MSIMLGVIKTNVKRLEIKDRGGKVVGSVSIRKSPEQTTKKRLPYSYKQISTRLLQTKKSGNAHQVLISARQKVVSLRLMYKNGEYNDDIVIMDNMRTHHSKEVKKVIKDLKINVVYLPPYSPDLNPIEKMWSKIKSILRKLKARDLNNLLEAIGYTFSKICVSDCIGWFHSCNII